MSAEPETRENALPEPTEQVHLPEPSYLPVVTAFAITLVLVGIVLSWILSIIGGIILIVALFRWIRETRQEISELPLEH